MRFVKAVKSDATVEISLPEERIAEIQAEAEAQGKAEFVLRGEIRDAAGELVATSTGTYQIRRSR
jgi:acyl-coenzyme A thioesterase PaaI-like protein